VLVVIGILIALQINTWNQNLQTRNKKVVYLQNLKSDLNSNIKRMQSIDTMFSKSLTNNKEAFEILKNMTLVKEFGVADSLLQGNWTTFDVYRSTYDEMINTGSFYTLSSKVLTEKINVHYKLAAKYECFYVEINRNGQNIMNNENLSPLRILGDRWDKKSVDLKNIDTTWINNRNSKTYLAFYKKADFYVEIGRARGVFAKKFIESCEELIGTIDKELKSK
jgi:ribosomal protein L16 Arg81 hydroxylase